MNQTVDRAAQPPVFQMKHCSRLVQCAKHLRTTDGFNAFANRKMDFVIPGRDEVASPESIGPQS
jgi:hypothetical protein